MKYSEITVEKAKDIISESDPLLLDTRDAHSYREEHIEGAMLAHDGLIENLIKQRDYERPVVIYCYHGNSSKDMAEFFGGIGFKYVYSLLGGYVAWKKMAIA
jgi:rhodanese-related sulfurtransferase